jgi:hypothetical protein
MELSLNIIVHELEQQIGHTRCFRDGAVTVDGVRLYNGRRAIEKNMLYLCNRHNLPTPEMLSEGSFLLVDQADVLEGDPDIVLETEMDLVDAFTTVQAIFERYSTWCSAMDRVFFDTGSLQDLFDLAEPFIMNNTIAVDAVLKLKGYTRDVPCNDPITTALIENGYHTEENIRKFQLHKRFKPWETEDDFIINDSHEICRYVTVVRSFKTNGALSLIVVMMCNIVEPAPWLLDTFELFLRRVELYVRAHYTNEKPAGEAADVFLHDLIDGVFDDPTVMVQRARYTGIPPKGPFCLFYIGMPDDHSLPSERVLSEITLNVAPAKVILVDGGILAFCFNCSTATCALHCDNKTCTRAVTSTATRLSHVLESYGIVCGRSAVFYELSGMQVAFEQARAAHETLSLEEDADLRILSYDQCYCDHLLQSLKPPQSSMLRESTMVRLIKRIASDDLKHGTDNLKFLDMYVRLERRATLVSEEMHMHRNNVKKRCEKISSVYGIDVDEEDVRLSFMLAYTIWKALYK